MMQCQSCGGFDGYHLCACRIAPPPKHESRGTWIDTEHGLAWFADKAASKPKVTEDKGNP